MRKKSTAKLGRVSLAFQVSTSTLFDITLTVEKLLRLLRRRDGERLEVGLPHLPDQLLHLGLPRRDLVLDLLHL